MSLGRNRTSIINGKGEDGSAQASFSDDKSGLISFNTTSVQDIGLNHFVIRNCDKMDNLNEINFFVHVQNSAPYVFEEPLKTIFSVKVDEVLDYYFPALSTSSGSKKPQITIEPFEDYEDYFPKFLVKFDKMDHI